MIKVLSLLFILLLTPAAYAGPVDRMWEDANKNDLKFCQAYGSAMARSIQVLKDGRYTHDDAFQKMKNDASRQVFIDLIDKSVDVVYAYIPGGKTSLENSLTWVCMDHMANHIRP